MRKIQFQSIDRPPKLSNQVAEQLIDAIDKNVFSLGEYLPSENNLSEMFNVSRGVIREALLMLATKGIVEIQKGKGAVVLNPTIDNVLDPFAALVNYKCSNKSLKYIHVVREMIEPQVAALAAVHRTDAQLSQLLKHQENMEKNIDGKVYISQFDIEFHKTISHSSENPMIPIILDPIFHVMMKYHRETFDDRESIALALQWHRKICDAIEARDSDAAFNAMQKHLELSKMDILDI